MSVCKDKYKKAISYKFGSVNVCVYRPILTPEENKRRMERIAEACAAVVNEAQSEKCEVRGAWEPVKKCGTNT